MGVLPEFFQFHHPTRVVYGPGITADLRAELEPLGLDKVFLVSDRGLAELGVAQRIRERLEGAGLEVVGQLLDVPQDAELPAVERCAAAARLAGAGALVAVGGGSVMDAAKAANILLSEGGELVRDYSGAQLLSRPLRPLVVIPTTAGTGSEVTCAAVVFDPATRTKMSFLDRFLPPALAVLDPELTVSLPPGLTAATAMDALTHAIEAFTGPQASPFSDALAASAVELIHERLPGALAQGGDIQSRGALLCAATLAGAAFSHSMVGCVHAMAHALGGLHRVPHGVANAIVLAFGMEYNLPVTEEKLALLAPRFGLSRGAGAREVVGAVRRLTAELARSAGLPTRLRDVGVPEAALPELADAALQDGTSFYNPREMTAEGILEQLRAAW